MILPSILLCVYQAYLQEVDKQIEEVLAHNASLEEGSKKEFVKLHELLNEKEKVNTK